MKVIINDKQVELARLNNEPIWLEVGTTNILGKVADIPNKGITWDTTEEQEIIGKRVKDARESKGINITQFAVLTGITRANIQLIEEGKLSTGIQVLIRICKALEVKLSDLTYDLP